MQVKPLDHAWMKTAVPYISLGKGIGWGIIGGLVATLVMDLILVGAFLAAGMPAFTCFSMVGDTVMSLFSSQRMVNSAVLGASAHYLIGPLLGAVFGAVGRSWKRPVLFAVLYAEIVSQPLLALTPIFLRMTASETLPWYGGSTIMHMIWGCVLGIVWSQGLRLALAANGCTSKKP